MNSQIGAKKKKKTAGTNKQKDADSSSDLLTSAADGVQDAQLASDVRSFMTTIGMNGSIRRKDVSTNTAIAKGKAHDESQTYELEHSALPKKRSTAESRKKKDKARQRSQSATEKLGGPSDHSAIEMRKPTVRHSIRQSKSSLQPVRESHADRHGFYVTPSSLWYEAEPPLRTLEPTETSALSQDMVMDRFAEAKQFLEDENKLYQALAVPADGKSIPGFSSSLRHLSSILQTGTLADRIAALTLVTRESPLHTIRTMTQLLAGASRKNRMESVKCMVAFKELFITSVSPNRKLKHFKERPLEHPDVTKKHLIIWAFEDHLKSAYYEFLKVLEVQSHDQVPYVRINAINCFADLLRERPEQEQNLLRLLVNKLGDAERSIASRASISLLRLLDDHPQMKAIIVRQISSIVLRPNSPQHARYYGCITLNQVILNSRESEVPVANLLMTTYFELFESILQTMNRKETRHETSTDTKSSKTTSSSQSSKQKASESSRKGKHDHRQPPAHDLGDAEVKDEDAKLITAVLTGVNRAFPFSDIPQNTLDKCLDTLYRITHSLTFNTSVQALQLLMQISNAESAQVKSQDRFYRTLYESLLDPRLISSSKQAMFLNLLFRAMKDDPSQTRCQAFIKRLLQSLPIHAPPFACGALYLLGELMSVTPGLKGMLTQAEELDDCKDSDLIEDDDGDDEIDEGKALRSPEQIEIATRAKAATASFAYDGRKREPKFCGANYACLWEVIPLTYHYHPSVSLYASSILERKPLKTRPDLNLHSITHFLDRFVYRNPKKTGPKGTSLMQPRAATDTVGKVMMYRGQGIAPEEGDITSSKFKRKRVEDVSPEDRFLHRYFANKDAMGLDASTDLEDSDSESDLNDEPAAGLSVLGKRRRSETELGVDEEHADEPESEASELSEEEIWAAMKATLPEDEDAESLLTVSDSEGSFDTLSASEGEGSLEDESHSSVEGEVSDDVGMDLIDIDEDIDVDDGESSQSLSMHEEDFAGALDEDDSVALNEDVIDPDLQFVEPEDDLIEFDDSLLKGMTVQESERLDTKTANKSKSRIKREQGRAKKKALRELPTFASAEDYAAILDNDPEENV